MSDNTLRVAVIGVGNMGKHHVSAYTSLTQFALIGIVDTDRDALRACAQNVTVPQYQNLEDMIQEQRPDAVSICVPASQHFSVATHCLEQGCHVLLEKPIASSVSEAHALVTLAKRAERHLVIGHIERFNPAIIRVKDILSEGTIGRVYGVVTTRSNPFPQKTLDVDVRLDLAIHDVDLANYFLGAYPLSSSCVTHDLGGRGMPDSASYLLKYENSVAHVQADWFSSVRSRTVKVLGANGYIVADLLNHSVTVYGADVREYRVEKHNALQAELRAFYESITHNIPTDSTHAVRALETVLAGDSHNEKWSDYPAITPVV